MPKDPQPDLVQVSCPKCGGKSVGPTAACSLCEGWGYAFVPRANAQCPGPTYPEKPVNWPGETSE